MRRVGVGQTASGHVAIADGLDLLRPELGAEGIEAGEDGVELSDDLLGFPAFGVGGEADDIREEDRAPVGPGQLPAASRERLSRT
jgi:hypothetical protein